LLKKKALLAALALVLMAVLVPQASGAKRKAAKGKAPNTTAAPPAKTLESLSKARISMAEKEFNFGQVFEGDPLEHVFTVTNKGTEPLVIERVAPG
jgi:hypothetical protein